MQLFPDRKLFRKQLMVLTTLTVLLAVIGAVVTAIMAVVEGESASAVPVLWIVLGSVVAALWLVATPVIYLWIRNLSYRIQKDKVIINKGILTKTQQNIPIRMVTDFRLQRSLYDRWLGIGSILLQTAGQNQNATGYEGKLSGLTAWSDLHEELQRLVLEFDHQGSAAGVEALATDEIHGLVEDVRAIRANLERVGG